MRLVEGLSWSYEPGAVCAVCDEHLYWHNHHCTWMECRECELLFNVESEEVFYYGPSTEQQFEAAREHWLSRSELVLQ